MINEFEKKYMDMYWRSQKYQWENYFEEYNNDLGIIDKEIYDICKNYCDFIGYVDRKSVVAKHIICRDLVDKSKEVSRLRNKLDDWDNYNEHISNEIKENRQKYRMELATRMKEDVLDLMIIRDKIAIENGFESYMNLILKSEEIDEKFILETLNNFLNDNLIKAKNIMEKYEFTWENWFKDLENINIPINNINPLDLVNKFLDMMGFNEIKGSVDFIFKEEDFAGVAFQIDENNIKIVVKPIKNLLDITVLFHELGHALNYYYNKEKGIYKIPTSSYDESIAVIIEYIAPKLIFDEKIQEKILEIQILEYVRCAISSKFEFELWKNPNNAEELYLQIYGELIKEIENPSIWAIDSFRSIDPVYIHNYVIGYAMASQVYEELEKKYSSDHKSWGKYFKEKIYKNGRKIKFIDKVQDVIPKLFKDSYKEYFDVN